MYSGIGCPAIPASVRRRIGDSGHLGVSRLATFFKALPIASPSAVIASRYEDRPDLSAALDRVQQIRAEEEQVVILMSDEVEDGKAARAGCGNPYRDVGQWQQR